MYSSSRGFSRCLIFSSKAIRYNVMGKNPGGIIMLKWASSQDAASILQDDSCHAHEAVLAIVTESY